MSEYVSQAAREAETGLYGSIRYRDYLDQSSMDAAIYWIEHGDFDRAEHTLTRSLGEALAGNNGD